MELQRQIQHRDLCMNSGDTIQIEAPDFDPDIDDISPTTIDQESNNLLIQGMASPTPKTTELEIECTTPAPSNQHTASQETDWPDAIPVEIPSQIDQPNDQRIDIQQTQHNSEPVEIPQLEENSEDKQYPDQHGHCNTSDDPTIVMGKLVTTAFVSDDIHIPTEKVGCLQVTSQLQEFLNHFPPESKEKAFEQIYQILQVLDAYLIDNPHPQQHRYCMSPDSEYI